MKKLRSLAVVPATTAAFLAVSGYSLFVSALMALKMGGARFGWLIGLLYDLPVEISTLGLFWLAARRTAPGLTRTAWRYFTAGLALDLLANVLTVAPLLRHEDPYYSAITNGFYFSFYAATLIGTVSLLRSVDHHLRWQQWSLDALIFMIGFGAFFWFLAVRPAVMMGDVTPMPVLTQAYTAFNCLIVLFLDLGVLASAESPERKPALLLLIGFCLSFLGDLMWAVSEMHQQYTPGMAQDIVYLLSFIPMAAAAKAQAADAPARAVATDKAAAAVAQYLPYAPAVAAFLSLVYLTYGAIPGPGMALSVIAAVLTMLLILRESINHREQIEWRTRQATWVVERRYATLTALGGDLFLVVDRAGIIQIASPACERVLGQGLHTLQGTNFLALWPQAMHASLQRFLHILEFRQRSGANPLEVYLDGQSKPRVFELVGTNLLDDPAIKGLALTLRDISERKRMEVRLRKLAFRDPLTQLANRNYFCDQIAAAIKSGSPDGLAVILIDLDDFKNINDFMGHNIGDKLLKAVAVRLQNIIKKTDTLARLGGDEFAILVTHTSTSHSSSHFAEQLLEHLEKPFELGSSIIRVGASIGISEAVTGTKEDELLIHAGMALHHAKAAGKNRTSIFVPQMTEALHARLQLGADIQRALAEGELFLEYQPIIDLGTKCLLGVEALARWNHPQRGVLAPIHFIPAMEESGQIVEFGRWALLRACCETRAWSARIAGGHELRIAVNVSSKHLQSGTLEMDIQATLAASGISPTALVVELTESTLMSETEANLARLREVKQLGVRIAIDDFGTGYSSLAYLHRFPIDILKIDRTFVGGLGQSDNGRELARAVISLGDSLGIDTVAEGIEEEHQIAALLSLGCVAGQGYLFQRPTSLEQILGTEFVSRRDERWIAPSPQQSFSSTGRFVAIKIQDRASLVPASISALRRTN